MAGSETIQLEVIPELTKSEDRRRFEANCWVQVLRLGMLAVNRYQREERKRVLT